MKIHTEAKVVKLDKGKNDVTATIELKGGKSETLKVDRVISAVGVVGNIEGLGLEADRKSTRLNSSHANISYAVFCLKTKKNNTKLQSGQYLVYRVILAKKRAHV